MDEIKERGQATINIELRSGKITVRHTDASGPVLAEWVANTGDWDKLWNTINLLKASA